MIISFSGRARAGKTSLANELLALDFKKISFADKLRYILCELYNWTVDDLIDGAKKEEQLNPPVEWNKEYATKLAKIISANKPLFSEEKILNTRREVMQFIGTEVLRKYDDAFHIKETAKLINKKNNFVIDDCRYCNELSLLKKNNAICLFIVRPYYDDYSNHTSETNLTRDNFDYIITNDSTKDRFINRFNNFFKNLDSFCHTRAEVINVLDATKYNLPTAAKILKCSVSKLKEMIGSYLINEPDYEYNDLFLKINNESKYWFEEVVKKGKVIKSGSKKIFTVDASNSVKEFQETINCNNEIADNKLTINSPYLIDDLKLWNYA